MPEVPGEPPGGDPGRGSTLTAPQRLAAVERAQRILPHLGVPLGGWARLAARAVGAPMGLLSLVGADTFQVVDTYGQAPAQWSTGRAPVSYSFCGEVIRTGATLALSDASIDPELRARPAVRDAGIRSYVGAPLWGPGGEPIGALGAGDYVVRNWPREYVATLEDAARLISAAIAEYQARSAVGLSRMSAEEVLDTTPDAFIAVTAGGRIVAWNLAAEQMSGWSAAETLGRQVEDLAGDQPAQHWLRQTRAWLMATGQATVWQERRRMTVRHRDGHEFPAEAVMSAVGSEAEPVFCGFVRDVTGRVAAERAQSNASGFLRALLDSLDGNVLALDADGRALPNEAMRGLGMAQGWSVADVADSLPMLRHPDGRPMTAAQTPVMRVFSGEVVRDYEVILRRPGRPASVLSVNGRPIVDADGRRLGAVIVTHDVTELRRAERFHACDVAVTRILARPGALTEVAEAVLQCLASTLGSASAELWLVDPVGGANRLTATWRAPVPAGGEPAVGVEPAAGTAVGCERAVDPEPGGTGEPANAGRATLSIPLSIGDSRFGSIVLHDHVAGGQVAGEQERGFLESIGTQIAQFVERRRADELVLELARTKDEFIALAGHSLRTPLTAIVSLTELLLNAGDDLAGERDRLLTRVQANAETLRGIVEDLLVLAGLESGHINLSPGPLDLAQLISEAVAAARPDAESAGVRIEAQVPAELPAAGDRTRLRQAVDNLLSNAVKYSPAGARVRVRLWSEETVAELTVADEGLGIPPEERNRLFNRFFRGVAANEGGVPGTGLGLPLTRLIAELHGGTIALTDSDGPGAVFTLRLPLQRPDRRDVSGGTGAGGTGAGGTGAGGTGAGGTGAGGGEPW